MALAKSTRRPLEGYHPRHLDRGLSPEPNACLAHDLADPWRPLFHALGDLNGEVVRLIRQYELLLARLKLWRFGVEP
jgi:hypothetical protein